MYYDRKLSESFASLLEKNGKLRWLFEYVKRNDELDFLIGRNNYKEWISVYRGLSRIVSINPYKNSDYLKLRAAQAYENIDKTKNLDLYGKHKPTKIFSKQLNVIINKIKEDEKFRRYFNNKKEGYFQNILSRQYGICGKVDDPFVIVDKECVIGYQDTDEKDKEYGKFHQEYKNLQEKISKIDSKRFGKDLQKKPIGNEVDFLAVDSKGAIMLIEYKHGTNTSGIYLSPLQIGMYYDLFSEFRNRDKIGFDNTIISMLKQKQEIGLVNTGWKIPEKLEGILPVLIISEYNDKSRAKFNFKDVLNIVREEKADPNFLNGLKVFDYTLDKGLELLSW